jgi:nucleoside-diphosphate-sugar epimerase
MRLFLTGATGFVGLNFLLSVLRSGRYAEITAAVRDPEKLARQLAFEGMPSRPAALRVTRWEEPAPADVDHAVHCAGVLFARNRAEYFRTNVDDTMRLLTPLPPAARVLVLSSQSAGGPTPPGKSLRTSADADAPITWYGESKLAMEKAMREQRPGTFVWRPPMILGPRDRATLPLFRMAMGPVRLKPGLRAKAYSWIAVGDLVDAMTRALFAAEWQPQSPLGVCSPEPLSDVALIETAARVMRRRGAIVPVPHLVMRAVSAVVDAVPPLRAAVPSLTRDRAREIFPGRWQIDGGDFRARFAPGIFAGLEETLAATHAWYVRAGLLPAA